MKHRSNLLVSTFLLITAFLLLTCTTDNTTIPEWPEITQQAKPWSRWWWHGSSVTKEGITAELEAYKAAGLGGLELTPIYGVIGEEDQFIEYLSEEWLDMLVYTLEEAERLGLGIDMATGTGWPFGGPWVNEPEACKFVAHKVFELKEGERLNEPVLYKQEPFVRAVPNQVYQLYGIYKEQGELVSGSRAYPDLISGQKPLEINDLLQPVAVNENLQALALDQVRFDKLMHLQSLMAYSDQGEAIDLTQKVTGDGSLNWTAPSGSWTLFALFQGWHGKMVERAAPGGEGNVIDHFSTEAIQKYLLEFDTAFASRDISTLRAFFNDSYEVDDARGQANWTPFLLDEFQKRRGYDLRMHFPILFGDSTTETHKRVLTDYRETFSDLILETFTKEWGNWASSKDALTRNQAHGSPANILDLYAASDIPETEGTDILRIKFASSAAHVSGKKLVSSESATWLNEHFLSNLASLKENLDRYFVGGVNHIFYHGTCYSPPGEEWPGRLFYAAVHANPRNPLWNDFPAINQYVARTQSFLQAGKPDNDILLYFPIYDRFATPGRELLQHFDGHGPALEGTHFAESSSYLESRGFAFDFISDRQIAHLFLEEDKLTSGGAHYQTILLPECRFMPLTTFEKLVELAKNGATILCHKSLPKSVPGFGNLEDRQASYQVLTHSLQFDEWEDGIQKATVGAGMFLIGDDLDLLLSKADIHREALVDEGLTYARRHNDEGAYYFVTNWSGQDVDKWISLNATGNEVMCFDPMTGEKGEAKTREANSGEREVFLQLRNGQSVILQTSKKFPETSLWPYYRLRGGAFPLNGMWELRPLAGGPERPDVMEIDRLTSWPELGGEKYRHFSGTVRYQIEFLKPDEESWGYVLDLGEVHESATIKLNGQSLGTLIGPAFQLVIKRDLLIENNILEIDVSNLMTNRVISLEKKGVLWKKFYNINFPARRRENRGS